MDDTTWATLAPLIKACVNQIDAANELTGQLMGSSVPFFTPLSLRTPHRSCPELVFLRSVFWLSSLLHECGGRPIRSCLRQSQFLGSERGFTFLMELTALRTHAGHNLDASLERDKNTEFICQRWYNAACYHTFPSVDTHWDQCTFALISSASMILHDITVYLANLKIIPNSDLLVVELRRSMENQILPYAFDDIVKSVAEDIGRERTDLAKFRVEHLSKWMASLEKLPDGYNFGREARLLVEQSFLANPEQPPVTGKDIIELLGVPQGKRVGKLLARARLMFENGITDQQTLLEKLKNEIDISSE